MHFTEELGLYVKSLPVLVTCFARPDLLEQSLSSLLNSTTPIQFFFHIDGPRTDHVEDLVAIQKCKDVIEQLCGQQTRQIKCAPNNLGVRNAMLSAISWFFENVEYGLIVEEDIVLHPDAAGLSLSLLEKFEQDFTIGAISLHNNLPEKFIHHNSDLFVSNLLFVWGWATWKNRWVVTSGGIANPFQRLLSCKFHHRVGLFGFLYFLRFLNHKAKFSWDGDLLLTFWENNFRTILSRHNLAWNIGFDERATHTKIPIRQRKVYDKSLNNFSDLELLKDTNTDLEKLLINEVFGLKGFRTKFQYLKWFVKNFQSLLRA
jgi:hypothetical protein